MGRAIWRPRYTHEVVVVVVRIIYRAESFYTYKFHVFRVANAAFIRSRDYRTSQFTAREERSFQAEVRVFMGNIP